MIGFLAKRPRAHRPAVPDHYSRIAPCAPP